MMSGMGLSDNEKVKCASFSLTMDVKIWWESMELKYNVDEMTWAQFTDEFNDQSIFQFQHNASSLKPAR